MSEPLWQWDDLVAAAQGDADGAPALRITGFSIDTRSLAPGDVFVALKDARDGHEFVPAAFKAGAAAAIVSHAYPRGASERRAAARRPIRCARSKPSAAPRARAANARIVAVTGSVGKTGTKEMLRLCLALAGATHAAEKSYNNHWGVPLTLARMPAGRPVRRARDRHEPRRRDRAARRDGAAARGPHHHGRAGAPGLLPIGRGHRRSQGRDLRRPGARRRRRPSARQPAFPPAARARLRASAPRSSPSAITTRPTSAPCRSISAPRAPRSSPATARSASPTASARPASTT